MCRFCSGMGWVSVRVIPVGGEDGFSSTDYDDLGCPMCNPNGDISPFGLNDVLYYCATPIDGYDGQYGLFENFVDGQLAQSILVSRAVVNYWFAPPPMIDCPVCLGWGIFSNNGNIQDCIACGGQPIEERQGFEPLHAWWLRKCGPGAIYMQRGRPHSKPLCGDEIIHHLEMMPNMVRVN